MLRALAASFKPHAWVNVHSGMKALFMPYDHRAEVRGLRLTCALHVLLTWTDCDLPPLVGEHCSDIDCTRRLQLPCEPAALGHLISSHCGLKAKSIVCRCQRGWGPPRRWPSCRS